MVQTKNKNVRNTIIYTSITAVLILAVFLLFTNLVYIKAKNDAFIDLKNQTMQLKENIKEQEYNETNYLIALSELSAETYIKNKNFDEIFNVFKETGFISEIGILTNDNIFITKTNRINLSNKISFDKDLKDKTISTKIADYFKDSNNTINSI